MRNCSANTKWRNLQRVRTKHTICARSSDIHPYFLSHTHSHPPPPPSLTHTHTYIGDNSWKLDLTQINITPPPSVPQSILPLLFFPLIITTNLYFFVSFSLESSTSLPVSFLQITLRTNQRFGGNKCKMTYIGIRHREKAGHWSQRAAKRRKVGVRRKEDKGGKKGKDCRLEVDCGDFTFAVFFFSFGQKRQRKKRGGGIKCLSPCRLLCVHTKTKWQR